jgi:hypothetical protein
LSDNFPDNLQLSILRPAEFLGTMASWPDRARPGLLCQFDGLVRTQCSTRS